MARVAIPITVVDTSGNAVSGASVTVRKRSDSSLATVYAAETGGTTAANPLSTNAQGRVTGWLDRGAYNLVVTGSGFTNFTEAFDAAAAADASIDAPWIPDTTVITTSKIVDAAVTAAKLNTTALQLFPQLTSPATRKMNFGANTCTFSGSSSIADQIVAHGLGVTPIAVLITHRSGSQYPITVLGPDGTNFTARAQSYAYIGGNPSAGIVADFYWLAIG